MGTFLRSKIRLLFVVFAVVLAVPAVALASDVDTATVDTTSPFGSATLSPGNSGDITINATVSGRQGSAATFKVYKDWTLSGGTFTGSNPVTFTVPPRDTTPPPAAQTFTTSGTVTVASGQAAGTYTLNVPAFDITNTGPTPNLAAKNVVSYSVTVNNPPDPCAGVTNPDAPVITANPNTANGNGGWYKTIPTGISATSATSGATITYATQELGGTKSAYSSTAPTLGQGTTEVFAKATSATCDSVSESSRTFMVDSVGPNVTSGGSWTQALPGNALTPDGTNSWYVSQVFNKFTATDATSGLLNTTDAAFTKGSGAQEGDKVKINSGLISDVAGNSSSADSAEFKIDLNNPSIAVQLVDTLGNALNAASTGWYNLATGAPTADFTCSDVDGDGVIANGGASGIFSCKDDYTLTEGANQSDSGNAVDNAGRTSTTSAGFSGINVDLTAPSVGTIVDNNAASSNVCTASGPPTQPTGFAPSDGGPSGINASQTGQTWNVPGASTFPFGNYSYEAHATDVAGNTNSYDLKTYNYSVGIGQTGGPNFSGALQPINQDGTSRFKVGSTVPVKFTLNCGSTPITDAVVKLTVKKGDASADPGTDEAISTAASTTGNLFRYDATGGQYIFNLSTKSGYLNPGASQPTAFTAGTWTLGFNFADGTSRTQVIQLVSK
jgi:hypothetical protein